MKPPRKRRNETRRFLPGFLPFLVCLWGCNPWGGTLPEHVLAQVNREEITIAEFDRELKDVVLEPGKEATAADPGDLKKAYLDQMIERKILAQEARRLGIKVSADELNRALAEIKKDYPDKGFDEWLGLKGMTLEEWKSRLEEKLLAEKMVRSTLQYPRGDSGGRGAPVLRDPSLFFQAGPEGEGAPDCCRRWRGSDPNPETAQKRGKL